MAEERLTELIEASLSADSVEALHDLCDRAARLYGFDHLASTGPVSPAP
ncbi:MAG: hypothetical protein U5L11_14865 [Arhodomonas sp.]|nr:hypothetical protein [Arhodomonas sp.]